jgi:hypothetical protein
MTKGKSFLEIGQIPMQTVKALSTELGYQGLPKGVLGRGAR